MEHEKYTDADSALEQTARRIRAHWFLSLSDERRDAIILPHFESEHPTNAKKKKAREKYENRVQNYSQDEIGKKFRFFISNFNNFETKGL